MSKTDLVNYIAEETGLTKADAKRAMEAFEKGVVAGLKKDGKVTSVLFLVWDDKTVYQLLGGSVPEYQALDTYDALIWEGIKLASKKKKAYDFEGSVIKRISKSFREFGGEPKQYFRIRKIFNPEIILREAYQTIERGL